MAPRTRLTVSIASAAARTGVPSTMMIEVEMIDQTNNGMRISLMPAARMLRMVTRKLMAPKIEDKPMI